MVNTTEILVIGAVILVLFGGAAIPKFFNSLGKAKREFQKGLNDGEQPVAAETAPTTGGKPGGSR